MNKKTLSLLGTIIAMVLVSVNFFSVYAQSEPEQNKIFYVSPVGDNDSDCTLDNPCLSINAVPAQPGNTIILLAGLYNGNMDISLKGTQTAPIIITGNGAILDGVSVELTNSEWLIFENITFINAVNSFDVKTSHYIAWRNNVFDFTTRGIHIRDYSSHLLIENNEFYQSCSFGKTWEQIKDSSCDGGAIYGASLGGGTYHIRDNDVHDVFNGFIFTDENAAKWMNANVYIYNNSFDKIINAPVKPEGDSFNFQIFNSIEGPVWLMPPNYPSQIPANVAGWLDILTSAESAPIPAETPTATATQEPVSPTPTVTVVSPTATVTNTPVPAAELSYYVQSGESGDCSESDPCGAISQVPNDAKTIYIASGEYPSGALDVDNRDDVEFVGGGLVTGGSEDAIITVTDSSKITFTNFTFDYAPRALYFKDGADKVLIEGNTFTQSCTDGETWDSLKGTDCEGGGVYFSSGSIGNHVVRNNTFIDVFNGVYITDDRAGDFNNNIYIHDNHFENVIDDPVELEGDGSGIYIYNNTMKETHRAVSIGTNDNVFIFNNVQTVTGNPSGDNGRNNSFLKVDGMEGNRVQVWDNVVNGSGAPDFYFIDFNSNPNILQVYNNDIHVDNMFDDNPNWSGDSFITDEVHPPIDLPNYPAWFGDQYVPPVTNTPIVTATQEPVLPTPTVTATETSDLPAPPAPEVLPGLSWEAEDGEISSPFTVEDGIVYQGESVWIPERGGRAEYRFAIQEAGDYIVKATVNAADIEKDSFFVGIDAEPEPSMIWDVPLTAGFEERMVFWRGDDAEFRVFNLSEGEHTLIIRGRESQTLLDKVEIVSADTVEITPTQPTVTNTPTAEATQEPISPTPTVAVTETVVVTEEAPPVSTGGTYYVSRNGNNGDGLSWETAWIDLNQINWNVIEPGDRVHIEGGVYHGSFSVGASGSSGNYITITNSEEAGHDGEVIIDGDGTSNVFSFSNRQYVKVSNITIIDGDQLMRIRTNNIIVDNVRFVINGSRGIDNRGHNNTIINSYFETVLGDSSQNDGIWSTGGGGHNFSNNFFRIRNQNNNAHTDAIQLYQEIEASIIANNFIWQDNTKTSNAQGIYIEDTDAGTYEIYNNVLYMPFAKNGVAIRNSQLDANIIGNTFYQTNSVSPNLWIRDDGASSVNDIVIKNNIFYSTANNYPLQIQETMGSGCEVDGNLFYVPQHSSNPVYYLSSRSLSSWNNYSFVGTDFYGNPEFVDASGRNLKLTSGSHAIDVGALLSSPYNVDQDGVSRPQGSGYDIGAFESGLSVSPRMTPPPMSNTPTPTDTATQEPVSPTPSPTLELPAPPESDVLPGLSWEAEDGEISFPFIVDDGIVYQVESVGNPESGGRAEYRFAIQEAGDYIVKATVNAADSGRNSFFVGMDAEPEQSMIWDVPVTNGYEEHRVFWRDDDAEFKIFSLAAGEHILIIRGRERQTLLDKVEIVSAKTVITIPEITPTLPTQTNTPSAETTQEPVSPTPTVVVPTATETPVPPVSPTPTESAPPTATATESPDPPPPSPTEETPDTTGSETVYDDKDSAFAYSGGWRDAANSSAYGGSFKKTYGTGSSATLNFVGQSFSVIYKSGPHFRLMDVYVDGQFVGVINQRGSNSFQQSWDYPGQLSNGNHTLKLVFRGDPSFSQSRGSLDAVVVR